MLFSRVQNLQDQVAYFAFAILGFAVPQTSHIGAKGCRSSYFSNVFEKNILITRIRVCSTKNVEGVKTKCNSKYKECGRGEDSM